MTTLTELDGLIASMLNASHCIVEDGAMRVHPARKVKLADIEKLATALRQLREENARLREALQPFAVFAEKFAAKPINNLDDRFYSIHDGTKWQAELRRSHCDTARAALAKPDRRVGQRRVKGDPRWSEYQDEYRSYHERRKQESTK